MIDYELENLRTARNNGTIDAEGLAILNGEETATEQQQESSNAMSANSTYSNYEMPPYLHIQRAEEILNKVEDAPKLTSADRTLLTAIAQVHVSIAQAQMQGNSRA